MTRAEAIRAALRAAVRDGDTELAKALTKIVAEASDMNLLKKRRSPGNRDGIRLIDRGKS